MPLWAEPSCVTGCLGVLASWATLCWHPGHLTSKALRTERARAVPTTNSPIDPHAPRYFPHSIGSFQQGVRTTSGSVGQTGSSAPRRSLHTTPSPRCPRTQSNFTHGTKAVLASGVPDQGAHVTRPEAPTYPHTLNIPAHKSTCTTLQTHVRKHTHICSAKHAFCRRICGMFAMPPMVGVAGPPSTPRTLCGPSPARATYMPSSAHAPYLPSSARHHPHTSPSHCHLHASPTYHHPHAPTTRHHPHTPATRHHLHTPPPRHHPHAPTTRHHLHAPPIRHHPHAPATCHHLHTPPIRHHSHAPATCHHLHMPPTRHHLHAPATCHHLHTPPTRHNPRRPPTLHAIIPMRPLHAIIRTRPLHAIIHMRPLHAIIHMRPLHAIIHTRLLHAAICICRLATPCLHHLLSAPFAVYTICGTVCRFQLAVESRTGLPGAGSTLMRAQLPRTLRPARRERRHAKRLQVCGQALPSPVRPPYRASEYSMPCFCSSEYSMPCFCSSEYSMPCFCSGQPLSCTC